MARLSAMLGVVTRLILLNPCKSRCKRKRPKKKTPLEPTGQSYERTPDEIEEQKLNAELDSIVAGIDDATNILLRKPRSQGKASNLDDALANATIEPGAYTPGQRNSDSPVVVDDPSGLYSHIETASDSSNDHNSNHEAIMALRDDNYGIEAIDSRSFDLVAATNFTDFNTNDLGKHHSSMHVRNCKSKMCTICSNEQGVYFVKSKKVRD